jgi:hypothetical protein
MSKQSDSLLSAMQELTAVSAEVQEAWLNYVQAVLKAKVVSDKVASMIGEIVSKPNIEIEDYEIDG